jgi:hypothetical protein
MIIPMPGRSAGTRRRVLSSWSRLAWLVAMCGPPQLAAAQTQPDSIYAYTDDKGQLIYVERLQDVPLRLRPYARRVDNDAPASPSLADGDLQSLLAAFRASGGANGERASQSAGGPVLYRYRSVSGRTVYTNVLSVVPLAQRAHARVELANVSLNSDLGRELDDKLTEEHARLAEQPTCQQLTAAAAQTLLSRIWKDHGPLVVCGSAIMLFIVLTPWMLRRVGGREWARTLSMAIPALALSGIALYATVTSTRSLQALRARADPCTGTAWARAGAEPAPLVQRLKLLDHMQAQQRTLEEIAQESR